MEGIRYTANEDNFGNIVLLDTVSGKSLYFQGEDADIFLKSWNDIVRIWSRPFGKFKNGKTAYRKTFGPYNSYGKHFDAMADEYSEIME